MVRFFPHSNLIRTRKNPNTNTFHPVTLCETLKVYWGKLRLFTTWYLTDIFSHSHDMYKWPNTDVQMVY